MVSRDTAFPTTAPKAALGENEALAKVENYLRNIKTPAMGEYGIRGNRRILKGLMKKWGFTEPTVEIAEKVRADLRQRKKSSDTERLYMIALNHMSVALTGKKMPLELPAGGKMRKKYVTVKEFAELMSKPMNDADRILFMVLFYTGARRKDMVNLSLRDIDIPKRIVWFRDATGCTGVKDGYGKTKNKQDSPVPIHKELKEPLAKWVEYRRSEGAGPLDPLFPTVFGHRYSLDGFGRLVTSLTKKYLGRPISAHTFRHGAASLYANDPNMPFPMVMTIMRHDDPRITRGYVHHDTEDILRYMDKVPVVF